MKITSLKILVCDDSMLVRKKFQDILKSLSITDIFEASNGEVAVELYKEHKPDIVFMDIVMPVKSGIDALKEIISFDPKAKVVMASSIGTKGKLAESINSGAYEFLQKPLALDDILKVLNKICKNQ